MPKLFVIDRQDYVLEGEFEKIRVQNQTVLIDEENILSAIAQYKKDYVDRGMAIGYLNSGFLVMPTIDGEQVVDEDRDPSFMIIDIYWNREEKCICGKLIIIDSDDGDKIKGAIDQGVDCFMSVSKTELYTTMDKDNGRMLYRISNIGGYELSIFNFNKTNDTN